MNLGELKKIIKKYEDAGATDATPVWVGGDIKLKGKMSDLREEFPVVSSELKIREDWTPNMWPMIIYFKSVYDIPDPEDIFP